uniref:Putative retrotransposon Ty1-copia subclass protein n=1 Tax=Tanacetum cinerariifolium TaxID=118510 RepID=A0A6L2MRT2_TANCI|nr:putative retrotransposon Ty1-copia subclass protein [Tanacetum cinerariifolium]
MYDIDLSSSNTNDSSIKKCIEKLQPDRLLNSTDIESFKKYVSCMSGKMARKPYSHQVERAKDLLGLIHTDVRGPFRTMSMGLLPIELLFTRHNIMVCQRGEIKHAGHGTSLNHEEDDQEIDKHQSDINIIRKSSRTRCTSDRMCLHVDAEEHELGDLGEPANYKAALLDPESDKWLDAMNVEMQSMKDNEVWDLVDLPPNGKTVGSKWLLKKKTDMDGDTKRELRVSCYTDAGYLTDADDLKSQTRYVFVLNGGVVDWKSIKRIIFATSSTNAEYIADFDALKEAVWI